MKKFASTILIFTLCNNANAALWGLSVHSRANCGNNESISWDATQKWKLWTSSVHGYWKGEHSAVDNWRLTRRSAGVHWGESFQANKYIVDGYHFIADPYSRRLAHTWVQDCDIYNGWWDTNLD